MDQQLIGEDRAKISRSKARHLRRKRLAAARRTAECNLVPTQDSTKQNSDFQGPNNIPSKSKARRLRKKKKSEIIRDSDQSTSGDVDAKTDIKSISNRGISNSLFKTELHKIALEIDNISSELLENNKSLSDHNHDSNITSTSRIPDSESNQLASSNAIIEEKKDKDELEGSLHGIDIKSSNSIKSTNSDVFKTDVTSDDDLGSPNSNSSSNLIEQYEVNTIQAQNSIGLITRTVKQILNTKELIENAKNLKISSSSSSHHSAFQPNASLIDVTSYSNSDLIINTDSTPYSLEEQQIIIDFLSDSSSDILQNNTLFYTNPQNKNKIHEKAVDIENLLSSEAQTSFNVIKDYSLPSTSIIDSVSPVIKNSEDSAECTTIEDSNLDHGYNEFVAKMSSTEKTREQIKMEREAKKAAKALAKGKAKAPKSEEKTDTKSSRDASTKASSSEQVPKDIKENVVKKEPVLPQEKIIKTGTRISPNTDNKENVSQCKVDSKSKRESKAERRAKQEAQRAAKEKLASEKNKPKSTVTSILKPSPTASDSSKIIVRKTLVENNLHEVKLFKHLYHERELSLVNIPTLNSNIHPAILRLGVQYANKVIIGSNARCIALLAAVKQLIADFERPSQADFTRGLEASLQECAAYLHHCRPMAVSMQNAMKHLKWQMSQLSTSVSDNDAKSKLGDAIDTYIREQILLAGKAISNTIQTKISNGDVILTYAFSSLIHKILIDAHIAGKQFRVIVVDGRPWLEGKEQLRRLAKHGIECSYILINALSFIMPEVSKVFLGAHAILANGAVMSRAGTAQVALMAKAFNVPVLVACETHKSCERVQTDSFVYNEIGDADELTRNLFNNSKKSLLLNWKTKKFLDLLNITFDVTPADLVSAVVTELAILPCTSIPVILRIKPSEI